MRIGDSFFLQHNALVMPVVQIRGTIKMHTRMFVRYTGSQVIHAKPVPLFLSVFFNLADLAPAGIYFIAIRIVQHSARKSRDIFVIPGRARSFRLHPFDIS